jgi:hypothetical protein
VDIFPPVVFVFFPLLLGVIRGFTPLKDAFPFSKILSFILLFAFYLLMGVIRGFTPL